MKINHSWLMVLCVIGMGSVFILPALGIDLRSIGTIVLIALCPLSHLLMIWGCCKRLKKQDSGEAGHDRIFSEP